MHNDVLAGLTVADQAGISLGLISTIVGVLAIFLSLKFHKDAQNSGGRLEDNVLEMDGRVRSFSRELEAPDGTLHIVASKLNFLIEELGQEAVSREPGAVPVLDVKKEILRLLEVAGGAATLDSLVIVDNPRLGQFPSVRMSGLEMLQEDGLVEVDGPYRRGTMVRLVPGVQDDRVES